MRQHLCPIFHFVGEYIAAEKVEGVYSKSTVVGQIWVRLVNIYRQTQFCQLTPKPRFLFLNPESTFCVQIYGNSFQSFVLAVVVPNIEVIGKFPKQKHTVSREHRRQCTSSKRKAAGQKKKENSYMKPSHEMLRANQKYRPFPYSLDNHPKYFATFSTIFTHARAHTNKYILRL